MANQTVTFHIPAIDCGGCLTSVRKVVEQEGATVESGDADTKLVTVSFDGERLTRQQLEAALEAVGFPPEDGS